MVILATSDIHLGYSDSNTGGFQSFLKEVLERNDVEMLFILGDFFDMWRRDVSGIFLENHSTLETLLKIKSKIPVHCIVGNHDFHLLKLKSHGYPIEFEKSVKLKIDGIQYIFKHGYDFDFLQREPVMELLCQNFSDDAGSLRSRIWKFLHSDPDAPKYLEEAIRNTRSDTKGTLDFEGDEERYFEMLFTPPNQRKDVEDKMIIPWRSVESNAIHSIKKDERLVFGHTHRPLVSKDRRIVNTGSWNSDEKICNTYVELEGKNIRLMKYPAKDITHEFTQSIK